jgi:hypothetical protein
MLSSQGEGRLQHLCKGLMKFQMQGFLPIPQPKCKTRLTDYGQKTCKRKQINGMHVVEESHGSCDHNAPAPFFAEASTINQSQYQQSE